MRTFIRLLALAALAGTVIGCDILLPTPIPTPTPTQPAPCEGPRLVIGEISDNPSDVIKSVKPLADYLAQQLGYGANCGEVKVVKTTTEMAALIENGEVDVYWDSIYPAALVHQATGAEPVLRRWRNCDPTYYSVIFTRAGSGINTLADLPGHVIAMDNKESTSGFALPAVHLIDHGLTPVVMENYDEPVAEDEVGIFFTGDDATSIQWLLQGDVDAVATDDWYYKNRVPDDLQNSAILLTQTLHVVRQVVLIRTDLEPSLQAAIKTALIEADENEAGLAAMAEAADTCRFDEFPKGIEVALDLMNELTGILEPIPGLTDEPAP